MKACFCCIVSFFHAPLARIVELMFGSKNELYFCILPSSIRMKASVLSSSAFLFWSINSSSDVNNDCLFKCEVSESGLH